MRDEMDIMAAYQLVGTYRGAAEICGTTHKTVKRVLERIEAGEQRAVRSLSPSELRGRAGLGRFVGRDRAWPDQREAAAAEVAGYPGSDRNFRRLVAQEKQRFRRANGRGWRPAVWSPGEYLVIETGALG